MSKDSKLAVILEDNLFQDNFKLYWEEFEKKGDGALLFLKGVVDPQRFGVAEVKNEKIIRLIEKPKVPTTNLAVTGLYFYTPDVFDKIKKLKKSNRGSIKLLKLIIFMYKKEDVHLEGLKDFGQMQEQ